MNEKMYQVMGIIKKTMITVFSSEKKLDRECPLSKSFNPWGDSTGSSFRKKQARDLWRSKWAVPKSTSLNFQAYREIQEISRLPKSFTDVDFSTLERQQTNASLKVSFAEELEDPDDFKCCDLQEHKKVTGRRKFLYQLKLTFVKLRAAFANKSKYFKGFNRVQDFFQQEKRK